MEYKKNSIIPPWKAPFAPIAIPNIIKQRTQEMSSFSMQFVKALLNRFTKCEEIVLENSYNGVNNDINL